MHPMPYIFYLDIYLYGRCNKVNLQARFTFFNFIVW